jgi:uncharacterized protein
MPGPYAIVRLAPDAPIPEWATKGEFTSVTRSADELSIVCPADNLPREFETTTRTMYWSRRNMLAPSTFCVKPAMSSGREMNRGENSYRLIKVWPDH